MKFSIVVAVDNKSGIGKNNNLPWRLPGDLKFFKQLTTHSHPGKRNAVIMGRKTWDSLPAKSKPLPERLNIIISRQAKLELPTGCELASSLDEALAKCQPEKISEVFVIGGSEIFAEAMRHLDLKRVYLTEIYKEFDCDVFFPEYKSRLELKSSSDTQLENDIYYSFKILEPAAVEQKN